MENDFAYRSVPIERLVECSTDEISIDSRAGCPPDDQTGVDVHHHRQVQPPLSGPDVRYVTGPDLMRVLSHKPALEKIWSVLMFRPPSCRDPESTPDTPHKACFGHQTGHTVSATSMTPGTERVIDARTAVDLTAAGMYGPDFFQKSPVRPRTGPDTARMWV